MSPRQHVQEERYRSLFETFEQSLNGERGTALHAKRREALESFLDRGFPTARDEEWRFTNVGRIAGTEFVPVSNAETSPGVQPPDDAMSISAGPEAHRLVFVNGRIVKETEADLQLPPGVTVASYAAAVREGKVKLLEKEGSLVAAADGAFAALNTAFVVDGAVVLIDPGVQVLRPIELRFIVKSAGILSSVHPRVIVVVGKGAMVRILQTHSGADGDVYFENVVTEIVLEEHAVVEYDLVQRASGSSYHVHTLGVRQEKASAFTGNTVVVGGALVRNTLHVRLSGTGAECTLHGLSIGGKATLIDNHTVVDHAAPGCTSHELYKAVLAGDARCVFNGKIFVREGAQKTDARQTNKTLLLSPEASVNTKPQLEIFADDVKCTHGATVGQIDETQLFYLRARGIGEAEARAILTQAFAEDVVQRIQIPSLRENLNQRIRNVLENVDHGNMHD